MDISVIIVNWNVRDLLAQCLESVLAQDIAAEIIVVDNASADDSTAMVRARFPQVRLVASPDNLGYAGGNNRGVAEAEGRYLFLLNPDTVVHAGALRAMLTHMDAHPTVGALGPQLLWADDSIQSSRRRFPTPGSLFWESTLLGQWFPQNQHSHRYHLADHPADIPQPVDWVVGAAVFIRREAWRQVGPIDETFFMYFEETDWFKRAAALGWTAHYLPGARVTHYEGKSSEQVVAARTLRFQRSKIRYAQKHVGTSWAALLRLFLWLTFAYQWAEEGLKWLVGHRRALRRERISAYGRVLREL